MRLSSVAHKLIGQHRSVFIKGCFILDGILNLHEIVHDLRSRCTNATILTFDFEKVYDSVSWIFLRDVLLAKSFDGVYVYRLMQLVCGGHTTVSINGAVGPYFKNGPGLIQGDPISPFSSSFLLSPKPSAATGHISHVISHLLHAKISHLQYANDIIILIEKNDMCIANLKFLILHFSLRLSLC